MASNHDHLSSGKGCKQTSDLVTCNPVTPCWLIGLTSIDHYIGSSLSLPHPYQEDLYCQVDQSHCHCHCRQDPQVHQVYPVPLEPQELQEHHWLEPLCWHRWWQAMAVALSAPGPGGPVPPSRVKIPPPIFKGLPGERPEAHLMRANDWMDTYNILPVNKPANFKHTLDHLAREWYDSLTFPITWNDLQQRFSRYFSTQGQSLKHLHDKWRNFSFTQGQDDIEAYIRDVKEAAQQLNYNDDA